MYVDVTRLGWREKVNTMWAAGSLLQNLLMMQHSMLYVLTEVDFGFLMPAKKVILSTLHS